MADYRVGVDIGGTFTDVVLAEAGSGQVFLRKVPGDPAAPAAAVARGVAEILAAAGADPARVTLVVHGTTMALNTVIERSGATVGLLATRGYRDVLELRRLRLAQANNFYADRPEPLVPRRLVRKVDERLLADGSVYRAIDTAEVAAAARELAAAGCTAIAICFLFSYLNGEHERAAKQAVAAACPGVYVCTSHEVWPQRREYERTLVTVINAYVGGRMQGYFADLEESLRRTGIRAPVLSTKSNGGVMSARGAGANPVETLFSGPASGVIGASFVAGMAGERNIITLDMGGTSADVSVLSGDYTYSTEAHAGEFPVVLPAIAISSIGAGGGSIAWTDAMGVLKVGPRSAGAVPGPACYNQGGSAPTVTDAYVTLGIVDPGRFLGGSMPLRRDLAEKACRDLGLRLDMTAEQAAWAVLEVATANMYSQFVPLMARHGVDPTEYAILAYGGAGPTHAFLLAREVGVKRVLVPGVPGGLCAVGCLVADLRADFVRTVGRGLGPDDAAYLESGFADLEARARAWVAAEGLPVQRQRLERSAEMRYVGQSFEVTVALAGAASVADSAERFHQAYQAVYGYADRTAPVEMVDLRVQVIGEVPKPILAQAYAPTASDAAHSSAPMPRGRRTLYFAGQHVTAAVYDRTRLRPGHQWSGSAVVEQYDTTTFVPPGFQVRVDAHGNLIGEAE